jgi:hypothetical protein
MLAYVAMSLARAMFVVGCLHLILVTRGAMKEVLSDFFVCSNLRLSNVFSGQAVYVFDACCRLGLREDNTQEPPQECVFLIVEMSVREAFNYESSVD